MTRKLVIQSVTIGSGVALTGEINLGKSGVLQGIIIPSAWTAANLTLQISDSDKTGGTFVDVYDDAGVEGVIIAAASRCLALYPDQFVGARFIKLRSGTTGTPVNQGAERTLILLIETGGR